MLASVRQNTAPNVVILNYSDDWAIRNLILVPSLFFTQSVLEQRPPLSAQAKRAGWIGCNILLANVPAEGKIPLIHDSNIVPPAVVRARYKRYSGLKRMEWNLRGWTLDVLRMTHRIGKREFTLQDVYKHEKELASLHPSNKNVRPKIRQQLQVLRDLKILEFLGGGEYRFQMGGPDNPAKAQP
jgi:type II restriction enzyme